MKQNAPIKFLPDFTKKMLAPNFYDDNPDMQACVYVCTSNAEFLFNLSAIARNVTSVDNYTIKML